MQQGKAGLGLGARLPWHTILSFQSWSLLPRYFFVIFTM